MLHNNLKDNPLNSKIIINVIQQSAKLNIIILSSPSHKVNPYDHANPLKSCVRAQYRYFTNNPKDVYLNYKIINDLIK